MSRKSLSKKEPIWYLCNNCGSNIFAKDRDSHTCEANENEINQSFVRDKKLFSTQLTVKIVTDDLRGINEEKLNNLIFLHESVFSLCDLVLGDLVSISSSALPNNAPIVRMVWPISSPSVAQNLICATEYGKIFKFQSCDIKTVFLIFAKNIS